MEIRLRVYKLLIFFYFTYGEQFIGKIYKANVFRYRQAVKTMDFDSIIAGSNPATEAKLYFFI